MSETLYDQCEETCFGSDEETLQSLKLNLLSKETTEGIAEIFKALGDPTRVKIIYTLLNRELCVHDISQVLGMGQSAISHQLRYLRNVRIVKRKKVGKTVYYSLDDQHIEEIFKITLQHFVHE